MRMKRRRTGTFFRRDRILESVERGQNPSLAFVSLISDALYCYRRVADYCLTHDDFREGGGRGSGTTGIAGFVGVRVRDGVGSRADASRASRNARSRARSV